MNYIEELRAELKKDFDEKPVLEGDNETMVSYTGNFHLFTTEFRFVDRNWTLLKADVFAQHTDEEIFSFLINDDRFFYEWLKKEGIEYLICAENIYGGQTVIDLTNSKMESYSPKEDGFICTDYKLSPNGNILAAIGCYWAYPFVIKLFDFTNPLTLPLPELIEIELPHGEEINLSWKDNSTLKLTGFKRERDFESLDDGTTLLKSIVETPVEHFIDVAGFSCKTVF